MKSLDEVLQELKEIEKTRKDLNVPLNSLVMLDDGRLKSYTYGEFEPSDVTVKKLCNRYKLSSNHLDILSKANREDLVAETFNHFLQGDRNTMMLRVVGDNRIKGIVPKDYKKFDDYDVFTQVNDYLINTGFDYNLDILNHDDEYTRIRVMLKDIESNMGMSDEGGLDRDIVQGGFEITNSEIGSKMGINSLVYRQVCTNGMMALISDDENKEIFYKRGKDFNPFSRVAALNSGLNNAVEQSDKSIITFKKTKDIEVDNPIVEFEKIGKRYSLGKNHVENMVDMWEHERQYNYFGVVNGITRYASREFSNKDYGNRSKFEFIASDVLEKVTS